MEDLERKIGELAKDLTDRQRLFVHEYMMDLNGTQAAIRAGYAEKTAAARASRLLRMPKVKAYRDALMQERFEAIGVTKFNLAAEVWGIYQKCCKKQPVLEWDSQEHAWTPTGEWQFDVKGALKALDMLRQMLPEMDEDEDRKGQSYEDLLGGED